MLMLPKENTYDGVNMGDGYKDPPPGQNIPPPRIYAIGSMREHDKMATYRKDLETAK